MSPENKILPITPDQIHEELLKFTSPELIETVNGLIARYYRDGRAEISLRSIRKELVNRGMTSLEVEEIDYSGLESLYSLADWEVTGLDTDYNDQNLIDKLYVFERKPKVG